MSKGSVNSIPGKVIFFLKLIAHTHQVAIKQFTCNFLSTHSPLFATESEQFHILQHVSIQILLFIVEWAILDWAVWRWLHKYCIIIFHTHPLFFVIFSPLLFIFFISFICLIRLTWSVMASCFIASFFSSSHLTSHFLINSNVISTFCTIFFPVSFFI